MIIAVIPARGGSKRIPGKNIKFFAGKPLIAYSIEAAIQSELFDHVFVSTDSPEIARVATEYGAEVPFFRSAELADDFTGTDAVVLDFIERIKEKGIQAEYVCCIYATAPFVQSRDLKKGYIILKESGACSAVSVTTFAAPIFRALKVNSKERLEMLWPEYRLTRSQDLPEAVHDAGQFYWSNVGSFFKEKTFWSSDALPIYLPRYRVQDIDTLEDWKTAEMMFKVHSKS